MFADISHFNNNIKCSRENRDAKDIFVFNSGFVQSSKKNLFLTNVIEKFEGKCFVTTPEVLGLTLHMHSPTKNDAFTSLAAKAEKIDLGVSFKTDVFKVSLFFN